MAISACFGSGRNKKKPFGRALVFDHYIVYAYMLGFTILAPIEGPSPITVSGGIL